MKKAFIAGLLFSVLAGNVAAQTCSQLEQKLVFNNNGTVTDKTTGLTWSQCSVGQQWKGNECTGSAVRFSYGDAAEWLRETGLAAQGFRLPTLNELLSITAFDCGEPAVHKNWQSIEAGFYWTTTAAFGGFQNTVLMNSGDDYPMAPTVSASALVVK